MPVIKPRTRGKQLVRHITRLDRENNETLYAYAQFLSEPTEYVLNQLIESVLAKDKDFVADATKQKLDVEPEDGEHLEALIRKVYATPKALVDRVGELIK